jgi:hypothetical protein
MVSYNSEVWPPALMPALKEFEAAEGGYHNKKKVGLGTFEDYESFFIIELSKKSS